ncbi:hypothetical protein RhiirA1_395001 [Rhizophagus irregularis]|uniref:Uncharacterized protein n=1 Tax=Rhizophagus irregularis TaxID=588596 RepID=A0A2N0RR43_9GLOM|nr:hypothetical protein RhiirA1_395001 [Rhizophagus irregularis]
MEFVHIRYEKIKGNFCLLKQQYYNISNENVQLRGELEQSIISSKKLSKETQIPFSEKRNKEMLGEKELVIELWETLYLNIRTKIWLHRCNEVIEEEKKKGITKRDKKLYNENKRKKDESEVEKNEIHDILVEKIVILIGTSYNNTWDID